MSDTTVGQRTALYDAQKSRGGRFIDFGGWDMPVQFSGILAEHAAVRERAGLFDISHMGQVRVEGAGAEAFLDDLLTNAVRKLSVGKGQYNLMCRPDGGVIDDLFVYRLADARYLVIVNASRRERDFAWMRDNIMPGVLLENDYSTSAAVALQGPASAEILSSLAPGAASLPRFGAGAFDLPGGRGVIARTGYTGEDGFEIFAPAGVIVPLYDKLLREGAAQGILPCGLGSRDTLRLEMGYRLYGQDLDEERTPLDAGLGWAVKLDKGNFIGRGVLLEQKKNGLKQRLAGFRLKGAGVPRHGVPITVNGTRVGDVTSGTFSPSLKYGIGMGYVAADVEPSAFPAIVIHGRAIPAEWAELPFLRKA